MGILDWLGNALGSKDPLARAERLYQKGLRLTRGERFADAVPILEDAAQLNPNSAQIHQVLGYAYSRLAGEHEADKATMNSLLDRAADTYWKAITLHREHGGLEPKQIATTMEMVAAMDRIRMRDSDSPPLDVRKTIYRDYRTARARASGDPLGPLTAMFPQGIGGPMLLGEGMRRAQQDDQRSEEKAIAKITKEHGITERQLRAIIQEGKGEKW